jgi:hypothetical protein
MNGQQRKEPVAEIREIEKHIIEVGMGRHRLDMTPDEVDDHITEQYQRLITIRGSREQNS